MQVYLNMTSLPVGSIIGPTINLIPTPAGPITPTFTTVNNLLSGILVSVNNNTTSIRLQSTGACTNFIDVEIPAPEFCTTTTTTSQEGFLCFVIQYEDLTSESFTFPLAGSGLFNGKPYYLLNPSLADGVAIYWDGTQWVNTPRWNTDKLPDQTLPFNTPYPISTFSDWITPPGGFGITQVLSVENGVCTTTTVCCPDCNCIEDKFTTESYAMVNYSGTTYRDGTPIPQVNVPTNFVTLTTGAWCHYNNDPANDAIYGKLYNWYAIAGIHDLASLTNPSLRKQFGPAGWKIPSNAEWFSFINCLGGAGVAGGKMKSTGTLQAATGYWQSPNAGATNSSGFSGVPGGLLNEAGSFASKGLAGYYWTSTENDVATAKAFMLDYAYDDIYNFNFEKVRGISARLIAEDFCVALTTTTSSTTTTTSTSSTTTTTTINYTQCVDCGLELADIQNIPAALSVGNLVASGCELGEYVIDWYLDSVSSPVDTFTSGNTAGPGIDQLHPFTGVGARPVLGGTWIPVIRYVVLDGQTYYSSPNPGGLLSTDLADCLLSVEVQNYNCENGTNPGNVVGFTGYSHLIQYENNQSNPADANKTIRFDISPTTNYLAFSVGGNNNFQNNISDLFIFRYYRADGTLVQTFYEIAVGDDIPVTDLTGTPLKVKTRNGAKYVQDLSTIPGGYLPGDYITIQITAGYIDPTNTNTSWLLYLKCLETFDPTIPARANPDPCDITVTASGCGYNFSVNYPGYDDLVNTDFGNFVAVLNGFLYPSSYISPFVDTQSIICTNSSNDNVLICKPISNGATSFTVTKSGNTFTIQFANSTQYNEYLTKFNAADTWTNNPGITFGPYSSNPADIEYYRYYEFAFIDNINNCGDTGNAVTLFGHKSSSFVFDAGTNSLTFTPVLGVPAFGNYTGGPTGSCTNCDEEFSYHGNVQQTLNLPDQTWTFNVDTVAPIIGLAARPSLPTLNSTTYLYYEIPANLQGISLTNWCTPTLDYNVHYMQVIVTDVNDPINNFKVHNLINPTTNCTEGASPSNIVYEISGGVVTTPPGGCPTTTTTTTP